MSKPAIIPCEYGLSRKWRRLMPMLWSSVLIIIVLAVGIFLHLRVYVVQAVECHFDQLTCPEAVIAELNRLRGQSIWNSFEPVQAKLSSALHEASNIEMKRKLPSTLQVMIMSSGSIGVLATDLSTGYMVVNTNGRVVDIVKEKPSGMTIMRAHARFGIGESLDPEMKTVLETFALQYQFLPFVELYYKDKDVIEVRLRNGKTAVVRSVNLVDQLNTLQLLLNEATMIEKASVVDLRFSHPVLR